MAKGLFSKTRARLAAAAAAGATRYPSQPLKDTAPLFNDAATVANMLVVSLVSVVLCSTVAVVILHLRRLKKEGKIVKSVGRVEALTGLNLDWILIALGVPASERYAQRPAVPGLSSGHPIPGNSAFGGPLRMANARVATVVHNLDAPTAKSEAEVAQPIPTVAPIDPTPAPPKPVRVTSQPAPKGPVPLTGAAGVAVAAAAKVIPVFNVKQRTLYATRSDPFYPQLSSTPVPLAAVLDTTDAVWEAAVQATAWTIGVSVVKPLTTAGKQIKRVGRRVDTITGACAGFVRTRILPKQKSIVTVAPSKTAAPRKAIW